MPLNPTDGIGSYIKDFKKSKAPQFKGKDEKKRRDMAIAAYLDARREAKESTLAGNNLKLFGRSNKNPTNELSMRTKWKAKLQRGLVGPSTKARPDIFRTTGKRAKEIEKGAKGITALAKRDDTRKQLVKRALSKEDTSFKVTIDGLPDMYMDAKTPGALLQKLRKIVKQPSLIKDVDRITKNKVKKAWRDKAQGRDVEEEMGHDKDWGKPGSTKHAKKITPGEKGKIKKC